MKPDLEMTNEEFEASGLPAKEYWDEIEKESLAAIPWYWVPYICVVFSVLLLFDFIKKIIGK